MVDLVSLLNRLAKDSGRIRELSEKLGEISDAKVAKVFKLSKDQVVKFRKTVPLVAKNKNWISLLGTLPDEEVAQKLGEKISRVAVIRKLLKISPPKGTRSVVNLERKLERKGGPRINNRWTDEDVKIITEYVLKGGGNYTFPQDFLSHRPTGSIAQKIGEIRSNLGICGTCKGPKPPSRKSRVCENCRERTTNAKLPGHCQVCGKPGLHTLVVCEGCQETNKQKGIRYTLAKPIDTICIPYTRCKTSTHLLKMVKKPEEDFLDVFGGSGFTSFKAREGGFENVVYNDLDTGLVRLFRRLGGSVDRRVKLFCQVQKCLRNSPSAKMTPIETAARKYIELVGTQGVRSSHFREFYRLQHTPHIKVWNKDCVKAIRDFRAAHPKGFLFLDIPYISNSQMFSHTVGKEKVVEIAKQLQDHEGRYLMSTDTTRFVLESIAPRFIYYFAGSNFREIVCSNFEIKLRYLKPLAKKKYNLKWVVS